MLHGFVWWHLSAAASLIITAQGPLLLLQVGLDSPIQAHSRGAMYFSCWEDAGFEKIPH